MADADPAAPSPNRRIPVAYRDVARAAAERLLPGEPALREVADRLESVFAAECGAEEEEIKSAYRPLTAADPVADQKRSRGKVQRPADDDARWTAFRQRFGALLERANYLELSRHELEETSRIQGIPGLRVHVDFSAYDRLVVYVKGAGEDVRHFRKWLTPWRKRELRVPKHERVVLLARLEDEEGLHLKLFRDIPDDDLEALMPGARFAMRLFDHFRLGGAGGTAVLGAILRATRSGALVKALPASLKWLIGPLVFPLLIALCVFYGLKTIWGYFRAKDTYREKLMTELFYQMLDSDVGVITRIVDEAEEEEAKESLLAWAAAAGLGPCTPGAVQEAVREHLQAAHGCTVDFDLDDALGKLARLGLVHANHDGRVRAAAPGTAAIRLAAHQVRAAARAP